MRVGLLLRVRNVERHAERSQASGAVFIEISRCAPNDDVQHPSFKVVASVYERSILTKNELQRLEQLLVRILRKGVPHAGVDVQLHLSALGLEVLGGGPIGL